MVAANVFFPFTADILLGEPGHCLRKARGHGHQRQHSTASRKILLDVREVRPFRQNLCNHSRPASDVNGDTRSTGAWKHCVCVCPSRELSRCDRDGPCYALQRQLFVHSVMIRKLT